MSRFGPNLGTAEKVVLLKLTSSEGGTWTYRSGSALYETRALTELLLQRLVLRGYLDETLDRGHTLYRVNAAGIKAAKKVRASFYSPTDR